MIDRKYWDTLALKDLEKALEGTRFYFSDEALQRIVEGREKDLAKALDQLEKARRNLEGRLEFVAYVEERKSTETLEDHYADGPSQESREKAEKKAGI